MAPRKGFASLVGRLAGSQGVCLTELMLSLTTGAIVLAAALDTFNLDASSNSLIDNGRSLISKIFALDSKYSNRKFGWRRLSPL